MDFFYLAILLQICHLNCKHIHQLAISVFYFLQLKNYFQFFLSLIELIFFLFHCNLYKLNSGFESHLSGFVFFFQELKL